jgi:hypothetical protein
MAKAIVASSVVAVDRELADVILQFYGRAWREAQEFVVVLGQGKSLGKEWIAVGWLQGFDALQVGVKQLARRVVSVLLYQQATT